MWHAGQDWLPQPSQTGIVFGGKTLANLRWRHGSRTAW
ncbi:hypothetical protein GJA_799 [Janthinobacterium agaricidamnosum NBRC 102515 = DSM 9628]|uniref:Uncharacterized protein n=1 Tax=Janthinobacterium agaricidamnosum NBRC 102515 = DSM 9628 TaxID=1349767 RepID=W0V2A1_9BURK|nr:hypothetical protein GJA_799 [Janthinobacterium agaricidamnosum NBRC 102515 = DSM 9628]